MDSKRSIELHIPAGEDVAQLLEQHWLNQVPFTYTDDRGDSYPVVIMRREQVTAPGSDLRVYWMVETDSEPAPGTIPVRFKWADELPRR